MLTEDCARKTRALRMAAVLAMVSLLYAASQLISVQAVYSRASEPQGRSQSRKKAKPKPATAKPPSVDYSHFSHRTSQHVQACDTCHKFPSTNWKDVRKADDAFPDVTEYPPHTACVTCHGRQFFSGMQPVICSVCHVEAVPRKAPRFPFPSLGEQFFTSARGRDFVSDFNIRFPHDVHVDIVAGLNPIRDSSAPVRFIPASLRQESTPKPDASCGVCHQTLQAQGDAADEYVAPPPKDLPEGNFWLKKGAFKTAPLTHALCFTCHSEDSGLPPGPSDCNACHKLPTAEQLALSHSDFDSTIAATMGETDNLALMIWRKREAGAFRHEWFSHAELSCGSCHNVATLNTLEEKTKKVPIISCGGGGEGCHITKTVDEGGILNLVVEKRKSNPAFQCRKCHVIFGKQPVPQSHLDAITAIQAK